MTKEDAPTESRLTGLGALLAGGLFNRAVGFLRLLILAPLLGPAGFGALRLAVTLVSILSSLSGLGLHTAPIRFLPELKTRKAQRLFLERITIISLVLGTVVGLLLLPQAKAISRFVFSTEQAWWLVIIAGIGTPILLAQKCLVGGAKGLRLFTTAAIGEGVQTSAALILALLGFLLLGVNSAVAFAAFIAGSAMAVAVVLPRIRKAIPKAADEAKLSENLPIARSVRYAAWYAIIPILQYLFDFLDRWALARFHGLDSTGVYSLAPIFANGMIVFAIAIAPVALRQGAAEQSRGEQAQSEELIWSAISLTAVFSLLYCLLVRFFEPAIWAVAGDTWSGAKVVLPLFLAYYSLFGIYWILGAFASLREATWLHAVALTVGAVFNTSLNLILVPEFEMLGAAWATLIAMVATMSVYLVYLLKNRITVPVRFITAFVLSFAVLLPTPVLMVGALIVIVLISQTSWFVTRDDRQMVSSLFGRRGAAS